MQRLEDLCRDVHMCDYCVILGSDGEIVLHLQAEGREIMDAVLECRLLHL